MIFILKLIKELYSVRIRTDINFLLFRVNFFFVVSDFILLVVSSDLSNSCFEMKLFTLSFSCSRLITLKSNFSSSYKCNSLIEQIPCVFLIVLSSCVLALANFLKRFYWQLRILIHRIDILVV